MIQDSFLHDLAGTEVIEVKGDKKVESILVRKTDQVNNRQTVEEVKLDGVFAAIGHVPVTDIFKDQILLDSHGYVVTRQSLTEQGLKEALGHVDAKGLLEYPTM